MLVCFLGFQISNTGYAKPTRRVPATVEASPFSASLGGSLGIFAADPEVAPADYSPKYDFSLGAFGEVGYGLFVLEAGYKQGKGAVETHSTENFTDQLSAYFGTMHDTIKAETFGATLWAKHQFRPWRVPVTPRLGIGYDQNNITISREMLDRTTGEQRAHINYDQKYRSLMLFLGLEIHPFWIVHVSADYGLSLTGQGTIKTDINLGGNPLTSDLNLGKSSTKQFRVFLFFDVTKNIQFGTAFVQKNVTTELGTMVTDLLGADLLHPYQQYAYAFLRYSF